MQTTAKMTLPATAALAVAVLGIASGLTSRIPSPDPFAAARTPVALATAAPAVAAVTELNPAVAAVATARGAAAPSPTLAAAEALRGQIKFETVRWGGKRLQTLDEGSRLLLARAAAQSAGLTQYGLGFREVYGLIEAETSWVQRTGASKNGTPNLGLAQFEPKTAAALGLTDPEDPVQAVFAAAAHMKDGARWAARRITGLKLSPEQYATKLREGISVYYNLSAKGRAKWDGTNSADLPVETQRHIANVTNGYLEAGQLARDLRMDA